MKRGPNKLAEAKPRTSPSVPQHRSGTGDRFFFLAPLYLALPAFLWKLREYRFLWVLLTVILFALGVDFFPAFQSHYVAAVTCLFILMSVVGLEQISRWTIRGWPGGYEPAGLIIYVCIAHFVFWYSLHMLDDAAFSMALRRYETWDVIDRGNSERHLSVSRQLAQTQGKQLVFVRYWPSIFSRMSGSTMLPTSTGHEWFGPVTWVLRKTKS
jgi:hypothetical protein